MERLISQTSTDLALPRYTVYNIISTICQKLYSSSVSPLSMTPLQLLITSPQLLLTSPRLLLTSPRLSLTSSQCLPQVQQVQCVVDGVQHLIKMEKALMAGESVDKLVQQALENKVGQAQVCAQPPVCTPVTFSHHTKHSLTLQA